MFPRRNQNENLSSVSRMSKILNPIAREEFHVPLLKDVHLVCGYHSMRADSTRFERSGGRRSGMRYNQPP
jgi:hypothetical protein